MTCRSCWCAECFVPLGKTKYPIKKTLDEEGNVIEREEDKGRFLVGRDGDHLMNPFQCENCQFQTCKAETPFEVTRWMIQRWKASEGFPWMCSGVEKAPLSEATWR